MSEIEYVISEDSRIGYRDEGAGTALVLVHGTGGDGAANWDQVLPHLPTRRILRPDYAGSGLTPDAPDPLTVDLLARQIMACIDHAGIDQFDLVGFSLGAALSLYIAARHPARVRKLVSLGGFASGQTPRAHMQFDHWIDLATRDRNALARLLLLTGFSPAFLDSMEELETIVADMVATTNWEGMVRQAQLDRDLNITACLGEIRAPTLVLGNRYDHMVAPSASVDVATQIDNATLEWIDGPHLSPMECPAAVGAAISRFLLD